MGIMNCRIERMELIFSSSFLGYLSSFHILHFFEEVKTFFYVCTMKISFVVKSACFIWVDVHVYVWLLCKCNANLFKPCVYLGRASQSGQCHLQIK